MAAATQGVDKAVKQPGVSGGGNTTECVGLGLGYHLDIGWVCQVFGSAEHLGTTGMWSDLVNKTPGCLWFVTLKKGRVWSRCRYGVSIVLDTAYWGFLGVGTTFDIFQNIHILYLQYDILVFTGYDVLILFTSWSLTLFDVIMVQPEGFVDPNHPRKASRSNVTFLILYVDDIIIMGNHIPSLQSVKSYLGKCFAMKDLGEVAFILGIQTWLYPMQERFDLIKTQGASTLEEVRHMQNVPYASGVGSIMYEVRCTRPDVAFTQNITSRFQQNPEEPHWIAVKTILKVDCFYNAGFETNRDDIKYQTRYVSVLNRGAVEWKSSKQSSLNGDTVALTYDSDILSEVPHYDTYHENDVLNSVVQETKYTKHFASNNDSYDELMSDSNVISYPDYMVTIKHDVTQYVPPLAQDNAMILSIIEQMKS
ncbi:retrotransposon protein, putative, ty1-copia subclass [Tanacetum coccineum]